MTNRLRKTTFKRINKALKDLDFYMELANSGKFTQAENYEDTAEMRNMIIEELEKARKELEFNVRLTMKELDFLTKYKLK